MRVSIAASAVVIWTCVGLNAPRVLAQDKPPETETEARPPEEELKPTGEAAPPPAKAGALPGPKYSMLRYDDDFSYLDGPEDSYRKDFFDPIKNIRFGEDWRLSLGGEFRGRWESTTHVNFGAVEPTHDQYFQHRWFLHADLRYRNLVRVFVQGINAMVEDLDRPPLQIYENRFDVHQLFIDLRVLGEDVPLTVRFGRQELLYGKQRLISPLDWSNTRRRFDGVKVFWKDEKLSLDFWYVRPFGTVTIDRSENLHRKPDEYAEETHFYGAYGTYKLNKTHAVDGYFLALRDTGDRVNANGEAGDIALFSFGGRFWGRSGPLDYDAELAGQWGRWTGDTIQAWMAAVDAGYTFKECPWTPRIGAGLHYASGDDNPNDGKHQTFNMLFPLGHAHWGWLDQIGGQNLYDAYVNLTLKPHPNVTGKIVMHSFWLAEEKDALYNLGGGAVRRDVRGDSGAEIGQELDITVNWQIDPHQTLLLGYSHMWGSNFIRATGPCEDPDLFYVQYAFKF